MPEPTEKFWNDCYAAGKTGWDRGGVHPFLIHLLNDGILEPCRVVLPGCGRGYEWLELANCGFHVTGIDLADEPVQYLRQHPANAGSNAEVVQKDIFDYRPQAPVDVVYEQTCLCAISPKHREQYEQTVFEWLKPGGRLFILFAQKETNPGDGPPFHCGSNEMKLLFSTSRWGWENDESFFKSEHPSKRFFELGFTLTKK